MFHKLCELVVLLKIEGNDKKVLKKVWLMTAILLVMQNAGSSGRLVIQVLLWVTCATPDKEASVADQLSTLEAYEPSCKCDVHISELVRSNTRIMEHS